MTHVLTHLELIALATSGAPRESFGPGSPHPYVAFELGGGDIGDWLSSLPCPVIGIGDGALAPYCDVVLNSADKFGKITRNVEKAPIAAMALVQHLRASESLSLKDALTTESFAYAALQTGPEFQRWKNGYDGPNTFDVCGAPLIVDIQDAKLHLTLDDPRTRNAIGTHMRDALCEALDLAMLDSNIDEIHIQGSERVFSVGGAAEEFGVVSDPATAHWVRSLRLPAWRLARLRDKLHIHVGGAAIGAGAEIAAFGKHITASPKAWFQLPELKYGLIPGAGGTASLPERIGRQRTAYMALSMDKINAYTALEWGLVDAVID